MLDVRDRLVVMVGGGAVAARKARRLLHSGARVRVVAPAIDPAMPPGIEWIEARYDPKYLDGAQLVFAATDSPQVNTAVVQDAQARRIWVNRADVDEAAPGDFAVPASIANGPICIAVTSGSPMLSRRIRSRLAEAIDPHWAGFAEALEHLRPVVREHPGLSADQRRDVLVRLSGDEALEAFIAGGIDGLKAFVRALPGLSQVRFPDWS